MITDQISLNLISVYLDRYQSNQGKIVDIQVSYKSNETDVTKSFVFKDLEELDAELDALSAFQTFDDLECYEQHLYELRAFTTKIDVGQNTTNKNNVKFNGTSYVTKHTNQNVANFQLLNNAYRSRFVEIRNAWLQLELDEYIKEQRKYIDCKYIQVYFEETVQILKDLYKKYKNI